MERDTKRNGAWAEAARLRRGIAGAVAFSWGAQGFAGGAVAAGVTVFAVRFARIAVGRPAMAAGAAATAVLCAAVVAARALKRAPSLEACVAALDAKSNAGGLFMSAGMENAGAWAVPVARAPLVRTRNAGRHVAVAALCAAFAGAALLLPQSFFTRLSPIAGISIEQITESQAEAAKILAEEELLPEKTAENLLAELERIANNGEADSPARMMEALDHISNELDRAAEEGAAALAEERAALQSAVALAESIAAALAESEVAPDKLSEAAAALADFVASLPLSEQTREALEAALADGLSREAMEAFSKALAEAGVASDARLAKLAGLKGIDPKTLEALRKACENAGSCDGGFCSSTNSAACSAALAAMLAAGGECGESAADALAAFGIPGMGGVSRGRGDAALTWDGPISREGAGFRDEALRSQFPDASDAVLTGLSAAAPDVPESAAPTRAGALKSEENATGQSATAPILPRHREAVKKYFE